MLENRFAFGDLPGGFHSYEGDPGAPPLRVNSSGFSIWREGHTFSRLHSELFGVEQATRGEVEFIQNGKRTLVRPGEVFLLRPRASHTYQAHGGELHKRYVTLEGPLLEPLLRAFGLHGMDMVRPRSPVAVTACLRRMDRLLRRKAEGFALDLSELAWRLLLELGRGTAPEGPPPLRKALHFIQQNLHRPFSSLELQRAAGVGPAHLNRLFRLQHHTTPSRYCLLERMQWAKHLLATTRLPVQEVAARTGFSDPLYFSAAFKRECGVSPRRFRG